MRQRLVADMKLRGEESTLAPEFGNTYTVIMKDMYRGPKSLRRKLDTEDPDVAAVQPKLMDANIVDISSFYNIHEQMLF